MLALINGSKIDTWMHHDPNIQDKNGNTIAMLYLQKELDDPPKWMHHAPNIQDKNGNTIAMLYVSKMKDDPLFWMQGNPYLRNIKNATIFDVWNNIMKTLPPEWIKECPYTVITHICKCCTNNNKTFPKWMIGSTLVCDKCNEDIDRQDLDGSKSKRIYCEGSECPICKGKMQNIVVMNKCGHIFCRKCVDSWISTSYSCPFGCEL